MINYFITSNYNITGETYGDVNRLGYEELTKLCNESFKKNLLNDFKIITLKGTAPSYHVMNRNIYDRIKQLYFGENCNILYVDSDTVCVKPTDIFGTSDHFRMYEIRNQFRSAFPANVPKYLFECFPQWFMSNLRYYPAGMDQSCWDAGDALVKDWIDVWAYECIIYNAMFYVQKVRDPLEYQNQLLNFQYVPGQTDESMLEHAQIIHVQATRGIDEAIKRAKEILK